MAKRKANETEPEWMRKGREKAERDAKEKIAETGKKVQEILDNRDK